MPTESLTVDIRQNVLILGLDDGRANALTTDLIRAIRAQIHAAEADDDIRAVVIHGRQGRFSGGFDLTVMMSGDLRAIIGLVGDGGELVRDLYAATVPVVAGCTGSAVAGGALMLLGCDLRIGADAPAKIGLNEVAIGLVLPEWGLTMAEARLSNRHVQRVTALAPLVSSREAIDIGFLDEIVAPELVVETAIERATQLAATLDPRAYAGTIELTRSAVLAELDAELVAWRALAP
jgi:enoyl-CoA hydratase